MITKKGRDKIENWHGSQSRNNNYYVYMHYVQLLSIIMPVRMVHENINVLASTVSRYCSIKYQTCEAVSMRRNWNPAGLMIGDAPGVSLKESHKHSLSKQRIDRKLNLLAH